jgi:glyoxylase-like metal-dependent hydrolase (beta-lactamase superfamily II)
VKRVIDPVSWLHEASGQTMTNRHEASGAVRWLVRLIVLMLLALPVARVAHANALPAPRQVSAHAWAWIGPYDGPTRENRGFRMNLGFVVGLDAVAVIDSGYSPEMAEAMLRHIRERTALPVRHVVNTNSQPHRFLGNEVFRRAGASVVAGREAADRMARDAAMMAEAAAVVLGVAALPVPSAPDRVIGEGESVDLDLGGGVVLRVRHAGTAHTKGSLVAEVRPDDTVFAGDILYGGRLLALIPDGSIKGWLHAFDSLRALDGAVFVPGHGEPGPLAAFEHSTREYLARLKRYMDKAVKDGTDIEAAKTGLDVAAWRSLANFKELNGRNAYQAYQESEIEGF